MPPKFSTLPQTLVQTVKTCKSKLWEYRDGTKCIRNLYTKSSINPENHTDKSKKCQCNRSMSQCARNKTRARPLSLHRSDNLRRFSSMPQYNGQDLKLYLREIGTDAREARFWLNQFHSVSEPYRPFAVIQLDNELFDHPHMLEKFASSLSFLQRNGMKCIIIHGNTLPEEASITVDSLQKLRAKLLKETMMLVSILEAHDASTRSFYSGSGILGAKKCLSNSFNGELTEINLDPLKWSLCSNHIPVLHCIGETHSGQLLGLDVNEVTSAITKAMLPFKVMYMNTTGGLFDQHNQVIPVIHFPDEFESNSDALSRSPVKDKVHHISSLLNILPGHSSVVITSAPSLLTELFTHHGAGTFFKKSEEITAFNDVQNIDSKQLEKLVQSSTGLRLHQDYLNSLNGRLDSIYLSKQYNAGAIITREPGINIPYLDKFFVSEQAISEGLDEVLWQAITKKHKQLFWRYQSGDKMNPWLFKRSEGSWRNGKWTIFWYGISNRASQHVSQIIDHAFGLPDTLIES